MEGRAALRHCFAHCIDNRYCFDGPFLHPTTHKNIRLHALQLSEMKDYSIFPAKGRAAVDLLANRIAQMTQGSQRKQCDS